MEIIGQMLLEGKNIPSNEEKAVEILTKAAKDFHSDTSKVLLVKQILSKESNDEELNYFIAKKYAKEVAENGNVEALILYGKLCEKNIKNKYGSIEQNFEEAFKCYKMAYEQGNPEGISRYAYYLENPHGLFTPDIKEILLQLPDMHYLIYQVLVYQKILSKDGDC